MVPSLVKVRVAREVVTYIHGEEAYQEALNITNSLFSGDVSNLSATEIEMAFKGLKAYNLNSDKLLVDVLVDSLICKSKREAREFITNGSISINGNRVSDLDFVLTKENAIASKYIIIRRGKKKYYIVEF